MNPDQSKNEPVEYVSHCIYLDKMGDDDHDPDNWRYFRITTVSGMGEEEGRPGSSIQLCLVKWPTFDDIGPVTDLPGSVASGRAYDDTNKFLKGQLGVERERSIFIGIFDRKFERSSRA